MLKEINFRQTASRNDNISNETDTEEEYSLQQLYILNKNNYLFI